MLPQFYKLCKYNLKVKQLRALRPKNRLYKWWVNYRLNNAELKLAQYESVLSAPILSIVSKGIDRKYELLKQLSNNIILECVEIEDTEDVTDAIFCR